MTGGEEGLDSDAVVVAAGEPADQDVADGKEDAEASDVSQNHHAGEEPHRQPFGSPRQQRER